MQIKLRNSDKYFIIDDEDYDRIKEYKWNLHDRGYVFASIYAGVYKSKKLYLSRFLLSIEDRTKLVDHINRDKLDNRKCNLRLATFTQNSLNRDKQVKSTSKFKGVYWNKLNSKWIAQIGLNGRRKYLGSFDIESDAARRYNEELAKLDMLGKFNNLDIGIDLAISKIAST